MAIPFLNNINLDDNQLLNAKLHVTSSAPTAAAGQIYFDSTTNVTTAKYYDGSAWIDLVDHTFNNGTYINLTEAGTDATRTLTADLSAVDGTAGAGERYLTKSNTWATVASIAGTTYDISAVLSGVANIALNGSDSSQDLLKITGTANEIVTTVASASEINIGLPDDVTIAGELTVSGTGQSSFGGQVTIPTTPVASTDAASKAYVDASVAGGLVYQGGYNASTNTPDLTTSPNSIEKGWTYTVTADGTFFGEQLRVGDLLIAEVNSPSSLADWTTVQNNIDLASLTQVGIGNVNAATAADLEGLSVTYSSGTATVGLDIDSITGGNPTSVNTSYLAFYDPNIGANRKSQINKIFNAGNAAVTYATTITDTATITHSLDTKDVIIQLYDVTTDETVYADVERASVNTATITFATTPTNSIRVLVQKIG